MSNRNSNQNLHSRNNSNTNPCMTSFSIHDNQDFHYFQQQCKINFPYEISSPINKMIGQIDSNFFSKQDLFTNNANSINRFNNQSNRKLTYQQGLAGKQNFKHKQYLQYDKKANFGKDKYFREENQQQQVSYGSRKGLHIKQKAAKFFSEQNIQPQYNIEYTNQNYLNQQSNQRELKQKYQQLSSNYKSLHQKYQFSRTDNAKLKFQKQALMQQNLLIKKQSQYKIYSLNNQIQNLKNQLYKLQMNQTNDNRTNNFRNQQFHQSTINSARGYNQQRNTNNFYVEELERQNQQLKRENYRLNNIVMKRLINSIN